jgi:hypothetical protein
MAATEPTDSGNRPAPAAVFALPQFEHVRPGGPGLEPGRVMSHRFANGELETSGDAGRRP